MDAATKAEFDEAYRKRMSELGKKGAAAQKKNVDKKKLSQWGKRGVRARERNKK